MGEKTALKFAHLLRMKLVDRKALPYLGPARVLSKLHID